MKITELTDENDLENWSREIKSIRPTIEAIFLKYNDDSTYLKNCYTEWIKARIMELFIDLVVKSFDGYNQENVYPVTCAILDVRICLF